ncbi:hypothetical protein NA57DRAFT_39532 [Rhizodiscina lignyota]|uniref:histidine kinase n=1 Tax=Rhizodiscina lignyota TaxID=1504668 RepID=A0A9P4M6R1_9PEZI|nr:hypothetical protein NA57DRAFT_39532 [Rhizodiscina lignyota]
MSSEDVEPGGAPARPLDRLSLCFSTASPGVVLQGNHPDFPAELAKFYPAAESNAAEQLVVLKSRLISCTSEEFWQTATEGIAQICGAQYAFISKRILRDNQDIAVEMPPIGEKGSCLMGMAYYYDDDSKKEHEEGKKGTIRDIEYESYAAPCAYMKHDKVFIIPGTAESFTPATENPNAKNLPTPISSYIAAPLFSEGKCFAHFGVSWSPDGEKRRKLSWGFLEMLLHSLEDIVLQRVLEGSGFGDKIKNASTNGVQKTHPVVPHDAITVSQNLKPYARSLSHELRTPMQGVVGMLDVMHATVQEAMEGLRDPRMREVFSTLRENIETVQDSSRRAVEAADNVVHAYDMNMGVPEVSELTSPIDEVEDLALDEHERKPRDKERRPEIVITGNHMPITSFNQGRKRRRDSITHTNGAAVPKRRRSSDDDDKERKQHSLQFADIIKHISPHTHPAGVRETDFEYFARAGNPEPVLESPPCISEQGIVPGLRHASIRDVLQYVVNDALRVGGRPDSAVAQETEDGEIIEVQVKDSAGEDHTKFIEWAVDQGVPETMLIDEKDFAKMISCVFLNAVKFTEEGKITMRARLSQTTRCRYVVINVTDTGPGIPTAFLPNLFKPFAREDDSLTRQSEGLGLGLLVAKGLARKLRGDLFCIRADTTGPNHGCEFEMRVPITPADAISRPESPFGSPAPTNRSRPRSISRSVDLESVHSPHPSPAHLPPHTLITPTSPDLPVNRTRGSSSASSSTHIPLHPGMGRRQSTRQKNFNATNGNGIGFDRDLAKKHPLTFLVAEDNKINRKLLVSMLKKLGYTSVHEAYDGAHAVRVMEELARTGGAGMVDVVLMDLWMPLMDGYEATEKILSMTPWKRPTILAVTADVTDGALERAAKVGMKGFMTKPYKLMDLERLIVEYCASERQDS